ncbi:MAG: MFS transporter [Thermomicrobiales bacterium]|nr:MFS transporter [Thermomicrobiales bacterium]
MVEALNRRFYYGCVVVAITIAVSLVTWGVRAAPSVLIKPLEAEFGWTRSEISSAIAIGLLMTAISAPFGGTLLDRFGPRVVLIGITALAGVSVLAASRMDALWQMSVLWGVFVGISTGVSGVVGASVATRWFVQRRGFVQGILGAGGSVGQLVFLPLLAWIAVSAGWREMTVILGIVVLTSLVPIVLFMRNNPHDVGLLPYGATEAPTAVAPQSVVSVLKRAVRVPEFWLLAGSFFVCGATSNGIVLQHFQAHAVDHGIPTVQASSALAIMGAMNFVGVLISGFFTDRVDPRKLLAIFYTFRGVSLFLLPSMTDLGLTGLTVFAVIFGLDYISTVPPTIALCADIFGRRNVGTIYGWVFGAHQLGAAILAYLGGVMYDSLGNYTLAFIGSGVLALFGGLMALRIPREAQPDAFAPAPAAAT